MITELRVGDLLQPAGANRRDKYFIPIYQRNFAWGEPEIRQLLQDIYDAVMPGGPRRAQESRTYHLGSLVVRPHKDEPTRFEAIDGQQRLTCLWLIGTWLSRQADFARPRYDDLLSFTHRPRAERTLRVLRSEGPEGVDWTLGLDGSERPFAKGAPNEPLDASLLQGYTIVANVLQDLARGHEPNQADPAPFYATFARGFLKQVAIMRVEVPRYTDLNHYFEVMNTRGEQLEKHEILKAGLLEVLARDTGGSQEDSEVLNSIWEACSNLGTYVHMAFESKGVRPRLFELASSSLLQADICDFDGLKAALSPDSTKPQEYASSQLTLRKILVGATAPRSTPSEGESVDEHESARSEAIVDFPNFLLHALRLHTGAEVSLDDKQLIPEFEKHLLLGAGPERVKQFVFDLLRYRVLLDTHVIRRAASGGEAGWSLARPKTDGGLEPTFGEDTRRIRMLLAAFHVSYPAQNYKYWLAGALQYLDEQTRPAGETSIMGDGPSENRRKPYIEPHAYLAHMEALAKAFVGERFLADERREYSELLTAQDPRHATGGHSLSDEAIRARLRFGELRHIFVFNYLDYLLWTLNEEGTWGTILSGLEIDKATVSTFRFTVRSSVEHHFPQNPPWGVEGLPEKELHSFGNLSLVNHSTNSRLNNLLPTAKRDYYRKSSQPIDSIKHHLMLSANGDWTTARIRKHEDLMLRVLKRHLYGSVEASATLERT